YGAGGDAPGIEPVLELGRGGDVDDPSQTDPGMGGGAHGAVLARGVDRGSRPFLWGEVFGGPTGELELRMTGAVARRDSIAILGQDLSIGTDEHGAEGLVTRLQRLGRK